MKQQVLPDDLLQAGLFGATVTNEMVPGHHAALIRVRLAGLAEGLGLRLQDTFDGLDFLKLAVVDLEGGERVALLRYRGEPEDYTEIFLTRPSRSLFDSVKNQLRIPDNQVVWVSPALES